MSELAILIPVLARPHRVRPLLTAIREATTVPHRVLFLTDPGDIAEQDAIAAEDGWMLSPGGSYSQKINAGVRATDEPWILFGADDAEPRSGWFEAAMATGAQVIGLNDLIPRPHRPDHATHFLVSREAASLPCLDGSAGPLCQAYGHFRVDDEFIATAKHRGMYAYAENAIVEHVGHPMTGGEFDETYLKGHATARLDGKRFRRREHLWA